MDVPCLNCDKDIELADYGFPLTGVSTNSIKDTFLSNWKIIL